MAQLSKDDVFGLARLARLTLEASEIASFQKEINDILSYVEKLQSADVDGLEPTVQVSGLRTVVRDDIVKPYQATPEDIRAIAPSKDGTSLKVKRVL